MHAPSESACVTSHDFSSDAVFSKFPKPNYGRGATNRWRIFITGRLPSGIFDSARRPLQTVDVGFTAQRCRAEREPQSPKDAKANAGHNATSKERLARSCGAKYATEAESTTRLGQRDLPLHGCPPHGARWGTEARAAFGSHGAHRPWRVGPQPPRHDSDSETASRYSSQPHFTDTIHVQCRVSIPKTRVDTLASVPQPG